VKRRGLKRIAEVTLALISGVGGVRVLGSPEVSASPGGETCTYEFIEGKSRDRTHVMLLDTHTRVYEVSLLMTKSIPDGSIASVVSTQQSFVENLAW
jgi:hypothetical protein